MSESRSKINDKEKMKRSDKCGMDCRFKDEASNRCMFETCLREEIPPLQLGSITSSCIYCGSKMSMSALSTFSEDRVCPSCRKIIKLWIDKHIEIINHVEG